MNDPKDIEQYSTLYDRLGQALEDDDDDDDDTMELRCVKDRVIVEADPFPTETAGGLVIPEAYAERPEHRKWKGTVREVGPGSIDPETGRRIPVDVKVGDRVMYDRNASAALHMGALTSIPAAAIYFKGPGVDDVTHVPKSGIRVSDGKRT
jgi:chaperonin GroES